MGESSQATVTTLSPGGRLILIVLILIGLLSAVYYFGWWFENGRLLHPALFVLFVAAALYFVAQVMTQWYLCLFVRPPQPAGKPPNVTVDVFLTALDEPIFLVDKSLRAAVAIRHPHKTYLIDDGNREECRLLAEQLGAHYLARPTHEHRKAGNVNYAMRHSSGEIIAIFDLDHVPEENFLDEVLGHFTDPAVGFVQVMLSSWNMDESYVAAASGVRTLGFFRLPTLGLLGLECVQAFGSNCVIRRKALEGIGGYKPGLAEDFHTSLHLHAAGWRAAYVPRPLAPGLQPLDLRGYFKQQLKWSRGVFAVLLEAYPRLMNKLTFHQRVGYLWLLTIYTGGPALLLHMALAVLVLLFGTQSVVQEAADYVQHAVPLALNVFLIPSVTVRLLPLDFTPSGPRSWWGILLACGTWPVYVRSFVAALLGVQIPFVSTPKQRESGSTLKLIAPQIIAALSLASAILWRVTHTIDASSVIVSACAALMLAGHAGVFYAAYEARRGPGAPTASQDAAITENDNVHERSC